MPFSLDKKPYSQERLLSGLVVARRIDSAKFIEEPTEAPLYGSIWSMTSNGEIHLHDHLRVWVEALLREKKIRLHTLYTDPKELPATLRSLPKGTRIGLILNTFPRMRNRKWLYTTQDLSERGDVLDFKTDAMAESHNQFVCVPTAMRRMNVMSNRYFTEWKKDVRIIHPIPDRKIPHWTGHMMAVSPAPHGYFFIGDPYGTGYVHEHVLVEMASTRNSFQGDKTYHAQIVLPQRV